MPRNVHTSGEQATKKAEQGVEAPVARQAQAMTRGARTPPSVADGLPALQRSVGNRAVGRMVGQMMRRQRDGVGPHQPVSRLVQRTPAQNLAVFQGVPGAAAHASHTTEGSKGPDIRTVADGDFIVTGKGGTWHHIYPRNLLKSHLENISKYLVHTKGKEAQLSETSSSHATIVNMASSFSMNDSGVLSRPAHYYWKNGNGYVGVRSDNRTDDPGSLVEHEKPKSMSSSKYTLPRTWGKEIEKLSVQIGQLGSLSNTSELEVTDTNLNKLATNVMNMSWELDGTPYRSVDSREDRDWKRTSTTHAWGADQKNYELVK